MKKFVINSTSILKLYIGSHHFMRENIKWWLLFFLLTVYKSSHPPVLAQRWMTGLRTRPKNEHKSEAKASRYANAWERIAGVKFDNNGQTGLHKTRKQDNYRTAYPKYLKIVNFCGTFIAIKQV